MAAVMRVRASAYNGEALSSWKEGREELGNAVGSLTIGLHIDAESAFICKYNTAQVIHCVLLVKFRKKPIKEDFAFEDKLEKGFAKATKRSNRTFVH